MADSSGESIVEGFWMKQEVELQAVAVCWNLGVEAAIPVAGNDNGWRFRLQISGRMFRWKSLCTAKAVGGRSAISSLSESKGDGGNASCWQMLWMEIKAADVFRWRCRFSAMAVGGHIGCRLVPECLDILISGGSFSWGKR